MNAPIYVPVFRMRQEEKKVLTTFEFGSDMFPYVEIFKELERLPPNPKTSKKSKSKTKNKDVKNPKQFYEIYIPTLESIKSDKVFVDLPVHLKQSNKMRNEVIEFLSSVVSKREVRTEYLLSLSALKNKVIPVISTYSQRTGEPNSILSQEKDLRVVFDNLAFRTSEFTFSQDMIQISSIVREHDFLIVDLEDYNPSDREDLEIIQPILDYLRVFNKCNVVMLRNPIYNSIKNSELEHGMRIEIIDNSLMEKFEGWGAHCFADYVGIKRDPVEDGGGISPGFIFYDAIENGFCGFKGEKRELVEFEITVVPAVLRSECAARMKESNLDYLSPENKGWKIIENIWDGLESGKNQAKFKRISMEHYLHCIKTKIQAGYFLI